jgi:hypothetical protein
MHRAACTSRSAAFYKHMHATHAREGGREGEYASKRSETESEGRTIQPEEKRGR